MGRVFENSDIPLYPVKRRWKQGEIMNLTDEQILRMSVNELVTLAKAAQGQVKRRMKPIREAGLYSYAFDKLQSTVDGTGPFARITQKDRKTGEVRLGPSFLKKSGFQSLRMQVMHYKDFLNAKTSTVAGIEEVNRAQDVTIFGDYFDNSEDIPRLTDAERRLFWNVVDEFRANPTGRVRDFYSFLDTGIIQIWANPNTRPKTMEEAIAKVNELAPSYWLDKNTGTAMSTDDYQIGYRPYAGLWGGITNAGQRQDFDMWESKNPDVLSARDLTRFRAKIRGDEGLYKGEKHVLDEMGVFEQNKKRKR